MDVSQSKGLQEKIERSFIMNDDEIRVTATCDAEESSTLKNEEDKEKEKQDFRLALKHLCIKLAVIGVALLVLFFVVFGVGIETTTAMDGNVKQGDLLLFYRLENDFRTGDVVTYKMSDAMTNGYTNLVGNGQRVSARIVAIAGDTVRFEKISEDYYTDDTQENFVSGTTYAVYINGYSKYSITCYDIDILDVVDSEFTISSGQCFLLNDTFTISKDTAWGLFDAKDFDGLVFTLIRKDRI